MGRLKIVWSWSTVKYKKWELCSHAWSYNKQNFTPYHQTREMHTNLETCLVYSRYVPPESMVKTLTERTRPSELGITSTVLPSFHPFSITFLMKKNNIINRDISLFGYIPLLTHLHLMYIFLLPSLPESVYEQLHCSPQLPGKCQNLNMIMVWVEQH